MGRGQAVGNQDHLPVRRVLVRQNLTRQLQPVLNVREVRRQLQFAHRRVAHVGTQTHDRIVDRHRLGQQAHDLAGRARPGEGVQLDELQEIARIFAANQPVQGQTHPLHVHVQPAVTH